MYTREIQASRSEPVENGKPLIGTWNKSFTRVDLLNVKKPYAFPLPRWAKDFRIKEWESFSVQDERFLLEAFIANLKLYQTVQVFLYNKETGESNFFRRIVPGKTWRLPCKLDNDSVEYKSRDFFMRVHTWLVTGAIKVDIDIGATKKQPSFTAHLSFNMSPKEVSPLAVSLAFTEKRSMYAYKAQSSVRGDIVIGGQHFNVDPAKCSGIFRDYKGYFPYRMKGTYCGSVGFLDEENTGEKISHGFHLVENQAKDIRKNNENVLWLNGRATYLPPVRITMPKGTEEDWVIQDVDGMVDLIFTPKVNYKYKADFLLTNADFFVSLGQYSGVLVTSKGEHIQARSQWGIGEKLYIRV